MNRRVVASIFLLCLLIVTGAAVNAAGGSLDASNGQTGNWPSFIYDFQNSRYDPGSGINASNVCNLRLAWNFSTDGASVTSEPIVSDGHVYFGDWSGNAYSVNLSTGSLDWKVHLHPKTQISGTPAVSGGLVYFAVLTDSIVYALNETTGKTVWNTTVSKDPGLGIWSSPVIYNGRLFLGLAGLGDETNSSIRGQVAALNATTGAVIWRFVTGAGTSGGAGVWGSVAVDQLSGTIFFGTGNPYGNTTSNLYSDSAVALNSTDGKLVWYDQVHADDIHDWDFGATPNLFSYSAGGEEHQAVGLGSKDGTYYVFDRSTGSLLLRVYLNGTYVHSIGNAGFVGSGTNTEIFIPTFQENYAGLIAFFPANQTYSWEAPRGSQVIGAVALSGGTVFFGDEAGNVEALSTTYGQELFDAKLPFGVWGGVTVASGYLLVPAYATGGQLSSTDKSQVGVYAYDVPPGSRTCVYASPPPRVTVTGRTTSASTGPSSTTSVGGGEIPEYPSLIWATLVFTVATVAAFVAIRRRVTTEKVG